ncbi:MAG TPA: CmcJ/NvfI family oxidoreductase, partial [Burkholderiales bacterium]
MQAEIRYTADSGEKLVNETFGPNNIRRLTSGSDDRRMVEIRDGRAGDFSLDVNGFAVVPHATGVADFLDQKNIKGTYYPEVEALIRQLYGARRVVVFDHTLRSGDEAEREARLLREPVLSAHNDYTEWSGPNRVRELLPEEAEKLL